VRPRQSDVRLACGECVPVPVEIRYVEESCQTKD
jgi:hypothetical protein